MSTVETLPWHASHDNLVALAHHLHDEGILVDADGVLDFIEKPWQWDTEWVEYQADENDPFIEAVYLMPANSQASADDYADMIRECDGTIPTVVPDGVTLVNEVGTFERDGRWYARIEARQSAHDPIRLRFGLTGWPT